MRFTVETPGVEEVSSGDAATVVEHNALLKARAVHQRGSDTARCVLGSDTAVALDGDVLGKPAGEHDARAFLRRLSGASHAVWSAVALVEDSGERTAVDHAQVTFRSLSDRQIEWYVGTGEWRGRAGGYAIQGRGAALVERIEGDYTCVVGLPVAALIGLAPHLIG